MFIVRKLSPNKHTNLRIWKCWFELQFGVHSIKTKFMDYLLATMTWFYWTIKWASEQCLDLLSKRNIISFIRNHFGGVFWNVAHHSWNYDANEYNTNDREGQKENEKEFLSFVGQWNELTMVIVFSEIQWCVDFFFIFATIKHLSNFSDSCLQAVTMALFDNNKKKQHTTFQLAEWDELCLYGCDLLSQ